MPLLDVHTHLTHDAFKADQDNVIRNAINAGLAAIVVNGLEPISNREILEMSKRFPEVKPALGIYPINAVCKLIPEGFKHPVAIFDVDNEIEFIRSKAKAGEIFAVGECGLDGYWVGEDTFAEQERVFIKLIEVSMESDLPIIIHTRKREQRSIEILRHYKPKRVNFHCFGGKTKWAQECAEKDEWWFSIPANAMRNEAFSKMLANLPKEKILTETDAPYLPPVPGTRNEPANVAGTIGLLARLRQWSEDEAKDQVWNNFLQLKGLC